MSFRARFNLWMFILGFGLTTLFVFSAYAQVMYTPADVNTVLTQKKCSGQISDLNCYQDIIRQQAHRMNVEEGLVPATQQDMAKGIYKKATFQGQKIMVDIDDSEACQQVTEYIRTSAAQKAKSSAGLENLCAKDPAWPEERFRTVTLMWESREEYITPLRFLTDTEKSLFNDTRNLTFIMLAAYGVLWVSPESFTNWNKDEVREKGFFRTWKDHVQSKPVRDKDNGFINYVAHPFAGSVYYTIARSNGLSRFKSFGYSVLMSTFFWEYGFEATVEKPSIQDLINTPVLGSILGEVFYTLSEKIKKGDGRVLGSKTVGKVLLFVMNPAEQLSAGINRFLGHKFVQSAQTNFVVGRKKSDQFNPGSQSSYIGIELRFEF